MSGRLGSGLALALAVWPRRGRARAGAGQAGAPAAVAATVAGKPIAAKEVDDVVRAQLMDLRAREHQLRSQALDALVAQALIEKEAEARGVTPEALYKAEVEDKAAVSDADAQAYYDANKARFGTTTEAEALEQIKAGLGQQRQNERRAAFAARAAGEVRREGAARALPRPGRARRAPRCAATRRRPVTIVEFSDFQCPYCVRARPTVARVREVYGDKVRFAFRHFPLDFHAQAEKAGEAAACAGEQGKFWEMHDLLWANTAKLQVARPQGPRRDAGPRRGGVRPVPRLGPPRRPRRARPRGRPGLRRLGHARRSSSTAGRSSAPSRSRRSRR